LLLLYARSYTTDSALDIGIRIVISVSEFRSISLVLTMAIPDENIHLTVTGNATHTAADHQAEQALVLYSG